MHQKLVMWKESGEVETIEADPQPFQVDSNFVEAQLYKEDVKPVSYKDDPEEPITEAEAGSKEWDGLTGLLGPMEDDFEVSNE